MPAPSSAIFSLIMIPSSACRLASIPASLHLGEDSRQICVAVLIGEYLTNGRGPGSFQLIDLARAAVEAEVHQRAVPGYVQLLLKGSGIHGSRHGVGLVDDRRHPTCRGRGRAAGPVLLVIGAGVPEVHMDIYGPGQNQHSSGIDLLLGPVGSTQCRNPAIFDPDVRADLALGSENPAVFNRQIKVYIQTSSAACAFLPHPRQLLRPWGRSRL